MRDAIVVTGAGSGIGRATAMRLLADGVPVVLGEVNDAAGAETLALAQAAGHGDQAVVLHADVRVEAEVAALVDAASEHFGGLAGVVNNAGVGGAFGPIAQVEGDDLDYTFAVLVRGVFHGLKHGARVMQAQGRGGSIVNVASAAAFNGGFGPAIYSAAKAAVVNLTRAVAVELAADRIRVNAVCPGVIQTPLVHGARPERTEAGAAAAQPWPEAGQPEDVAAAIAYLAGDGARFVTGEALVVDGGLLAAGPGRDFASALGTDPGRRGMVGVSRGSTGEQAVIRHRPEQPGR